MMLKLQKQNLKHLQGVHLLGIVYLNLIYFYIYIKVIKMI